MINKIAHLGIAVRSIAAARVLYETVLGLPCEGEEVVASQQVRTAFFTVGDTHIELLEPTGPESPIAKFLESRGEGFIISPTAPTTSTPNSRRPVSRGCD